MRFFKNFPLEKFVANFQSNFICSENNKNISLFIKTLIQINYVDLLLKLLSLNPNNFPKIHYLNGHRMRKIFLEFFFLVGL